MLRPAVLTIATLTLIAGACARQTRPKSQTSEGKSASGDPVIEVSSADDASASDDPCSQMFSNLFVKADSVAYNEYEVVRLHKTVLDDFYGKSLGPG